MLTQTDVNGATVLFPMPGMGGLARRPADRRSGGPLAEASGVTVSYGRNAEIFAEGEPSGKVYKVVSGTVRVYKILSDGRRQISAFCLPGDMFGLEPDEEHHVSAEAVVPTKAVVYKLSGLLAPGPRNESLARELWDVAMTSLRRTHEHVLLLGRKSARERVAAFLLEMAERRPGAATVELAMPRHDIADYLGLTLETVSRMFAELKEMAVIGLPSARRVELLDIAALRDMSA